MYYSFFEAHIAAKLPHMATFDIHRDELVISTTNEDSANSARVKAES